MMFQKKIYFVGVILFLVVVRVDLIAAKLIIHQIDISNFPQLKVYVSVLDDKGRCILGLSQENFNILEDNKVVGDFKCSSIFPQREWLAIVLAIDVSGSMKGKPLKEAKIGAIEFLNRIGLQDKVALVVFNEKVKWLADFSGERDIRLIQDKIEELRSGGNTALYDAISESIVGLEKIVAPRKAIIVLTDGVDTRSSTRFKNLLEFLKNKKIPIFTIGLGDKVDKEALEKIGQVSKGYSFFTLDSTQLRTIYSLIAEQLVNQYILLYTFAGRKDIITHTLSVEARLNGELLKDKLYYSLETYFPSEKRIEPTSSKLVLIGLLGGILGLVFFSLTAILWLNQVPSILKYSYILLGTFLGVIIGILFAYYI